MKLLKVYQLMNDFLFVAWRSVSPTWESPSDLGFDLDYTDEQQDDDDTSADDSVSNLFTYGSKKD